jgi:hypothetical protein
VLGGDGSRIPFKVLVDRAVLLKKIIRDAKFYKVVIKDRKKRLVDYDADFEERITNAIYDSYEELNNVLEETIDMTKDGRIFGVYEKESFNDNGGNSMLHFLYKALGFFIVPKQYISDNNGVPKLMCFSDIDDYIKKMMSTKSNGECCLNNNYQYWGGDEFLVFLKNKKQTINQEIAYWQNALFMEENTYPSPNISVDLVLTEDAYNIGRYTAVAFPDEIESETGLVRDIISDSYLNALRKNAITYSEYFDADANEYKTHVFPLILEEHLVQNDGEERYYYELAPPYDKTCVRNLTIQDDKNYGDIIYDVQYYDNGTVDVYYAIGAQLIKDEDDGHYVLKKRDTNERISFNEYIRGVFSDTTKLLTVDQFLFLKEEFGVESNYDDTTIYKGNYTEAFDGFYPKNDNEIWVFNIPNRTITIDNKVINGYYLITNKERDIFVFGSYLISEIFDGARYVVRGEWKYVDYTDTVNNNEVIRQLHQGKKGYVNILEDTSFVLNADEAQVMDMSQAPEVAEGVFYNFKEEYTNPPLIMMDYDFGEIDTIIDNAQDVLINRGYVSTFELHYKMGEINTLEDMENYQNNYFEL